MGTALDNFQKCGAKDFGATKIELDVGKKGLKPEQEPDNPCDLSRSVIRAANSPGIDVTTLIFPKDDVLWVSWKHSEDNIAAGKNVNVAVADYLTTQARPKV